MCPVKSTGLSKSLTIVESWCKSLASPHAETSTEWSGVTSPMADPGRKATVLAHKDLAVQIVDVNKNNWFICATLNANCMTGGLPNDLMRSDPGRT